jgi:HK97 family phage major capsid protein
MGDVMTKRLLDERAATEQKMAGIETVAVEQKRDLTEADIKSLQTYRDRIKSLDAQLEETTQNIALAAATRERVEQYSGEVINGHSYRSAGELLWDVLHQNDRDARNRYAAVQQRAAQHMGTKAELTVATAGGFGGLIVSPVTGPVIDLRPKGRPFLSLIGARPSPDSMSFMRPRLVDPNFATGVDVQAKEKQELASQAFNIVADPLQLTTVGGYLNVSQQAIAFVAGALDIVIGQLLARVAAKSEAALVTEVAKTTAKVTLAASAPADDVRQAIFDASALVFTNTGALAEWIAMGPVGWARLGGLTDLALRPLFPMDAPVNAMGTASPGTFTIAGLGLTAVVTPAITDGTFYVGNSYGIEAYEYSYPVLEAVEPSLLGRQVAVATSNVFYRPTTKEAGAGGTPPAEGNGVVKIAP